MTKPLVCGIIGCGVIGPVHAESFARVENVRIKWACDLAKEKTEKVAAAYPVSGITTEYRKVIEDPEVDCVAVCTEHSSHAGIVCAALDAGKHVLCEKALAPNEADLAKMFAAHSRHKELVFSGVLQHRFEAILRCAKKLVDRGIFGAPLTCTVQLQCLRTNQYYKADAWRGTWAREGGSALINQAIHFIDIGAWMMGGVSHVCGQYANLTHQGVIETEDTATASLRFRNGALGTIVATTSNTVIEWEYTLAVSGSLGMLEICNGTCSRLELANKELGEQVAKELKTSEREGALPVGKSCYGTAHPLQTVDFIDAIRAGRQPYVRGLDARHCVDIVLAVYESNRSGRTVTIGE
jgi:predicted dehydrogenase